MSIQRVILPFTRRLAMPTAAAIAVLFGLATLKSGGSVLFVDGAARIAAGNYVPFVLWFNFLSGFACIAMGAGLWLRRTWTTKLSLLMLVATLIVFVAFGIFVLANGDYELRTVGAMVLRSTVWLTLWLYSRHMPGKARI
jgi:hypothetical protein